MASRDALLAEARQILDLDAFPDYGPMGMQVVGAAEVTRIACGVSASLELFERAAAAGAEFLIVHHGLLWENEPRVIDRRMRGRLEALFAGDITLAAYHLALDAHPEVGNNALLARELGLDVDGRFQALGVGGRLPEPASIEAFVTRIRERLGSEPIVFDCGPAAVGRVAIVTGGAARYVVEAAAEGYDAYVTGEPAEPTLATAKELGIHFIAAGHYATERLGVQALAARLAETFGVEWEFIDVPTPV